MSRKPANNPLREQLAKELGRRRIAFALWRWLESEGHIVDVAPFPPDEKLNLLKAAVRKYEEEEAEDQTDDQGGGHQMLAAPRMMLGIAKDDEARAVAVSEALALVATGLPEVVSFRNNRLGGRTSAPEVTGEQIAALSEGALHELYDLVRSLAVRFSWDEKDAAFFVVGGVIPPVLPVVARVERRDLLDEWPDDQASGALRTMATITLQVEPWVNDETVVAAYRSLQRDMMGKHRKQVESREIEVFRFATRRLDPHGRPPTSWADLAREWNSEHADDGWAYVDLYDFKAAYRRVRRRLLNEDYRVLQPDGDLPRPHDAVRSQSVDYQPILDGLTHIAWHSETGDR